MAAPDALRYAAVAAAHDRIAGPLVATVGALSLAQVTRPVRLLNVLFALWMLIAPWVLGYPIVAGLHSIVVGLLLAFGAGAFGD